MKQDRQASHIADTMKKQGKSAKEAKAIGYATVNKHKYSGKGTRARLNTAASKHFFNSKRSD